MKHGSRDFLGEQQFFIDRGGMVYFDHGDIIGEVPTRGMPRATHAPWVTF
jgi:hypothetical protein